MKVKEENEKVGLKLNIQKTKIWYHHFMGNRWGDRGTRDQIADICWIMGKAREFQKNIYFCFINYVKAFDCVDHNNLWKILKEMGLPDPLTCS